MQRGSTEGGGVAPTVLLVEPPFYRLYDAAYSLCRFPLSLGYLAAVARRETDWRVRVANLDFSRVNRRKENCHLSGKGFENYRRNLQDLSAPIWAETRDVLATYRPRLLGITSKSANFASARTVARLAKDFQVHVCVFGATADEVKYRAQLADLVPDGSQPLGENFDLAQPQGHWSIFLAGNRFIDKIDPSPATGI